MFRKGLPILACCIIMLIGSTLLAQPQERGQLISSELIETYTTEDIQAQYDELGIGPFASVLPITYAVDIYKIVYKTLDVWGEEIITASGAVMIPVDYECEAPIFHYNHGTTVDGTMSELTAEFFVGLPISTDGVVSILPDYLGYGESKNGPHGYNMFKPLARDGVDILRATKQFCAENGFALSGELFISGLSEGGYAAMAVHREIEENHADEITVTASAPASGAYVVYPITRDSIINETSRNASNVSFIVYAYQTVYNVVDNWSDVLVAPYDSIVPALWNRANPNPSLSSQLPEFAKDLFQPALFAEVLANPDHPFNIRLRENNIYKWVPKAPLRMYYCEADEQVPYNNAVATLDTMLRLGAENVSAVSMGANFNHGDCHPPSLISAKQWFDTFRQPCVKVGLESVDQLQTKIRVVPNPLSETAYLQLPANSIAGKNIQVNIYALSGKKIQTHTYANISNIELQRNDLQSGLYILEAVSGQQSFRTKLVID